jgi:hypothetical protein
MPPQRKPPSKRASATKSKPRAKKSPGKEQPKKAAEGLFGETLVHNLKTMPPGTSDQAVLLATLRSVPPEEVKAALAKATPRERHLFFSVLPADQIRAIVGSLPPELLAPTEPPAPEPLPAPVGGPPASILETTYVNEPFPPAEQDPEWTKHLTGGLTIHDFGSGVYEWTPVYDSRFEQEGSLNNPVVGLTGWAIPSENPMSLSQGDVWFTHPFGFDWEYYIAPDPQYESLLAPDLANTGRKDPNDPNTVTDHDYDAAANAARGLGLPIPLGVLGVEIDQDLVPAAFRDNVKAGTRVATFGRWIVDSGHPDFHTEIHPPLLIATATPAPPLQGVSRASEMTHVEIMSRPYTVSQRFAEGNFVDHLIVEVAKVEDTTLGIPSSWQVEAHPTVLSPPSQGRPYIKLLVKPPVPRNQLELQQLIVNFHFTVRTGVAVQAFDAGNDTVGLIIVLGSLNPSPLPAKHDSTIQWDQLGDEYSWLIDGLQIVDLLTGKAISAIVLNRGILTDRYDPPIASSSHDFENLAGPVPIDELLHAPVGGFQLPPGCSIDDGQPFPIYGWMNVYWQERDIVIE